MFFKKGVLKKIGNINRKTPVLESLFNTIVAMLSAHSFSMHPFSGKGTLGTNGLKREFNTGVFVLILQNFRTAFS